MDPKPWYARKRYLIPLGILSFVVVINASGNSSTPLSPLPVVNTPETTQVNEAQTSGEVKGASVKQDQPVQAQSSEPTLSNDNYYKNVDGNTVHSPAYSDTIPDGASAVCRDGTYSFSQNRRGTCSHHGGVSEWLY